MIYSRKEHYLFLEEELKAQTDQFQQKLDTAASYLLNEREELFISQFVKIENGEMILKFSNSRGLPRKGEYLYCFTTPNHLHLFKEWGKTTYGDLIKAKGFATELVCIWQAPLRDNPNYCLVGFRGVSLEFAEHITGHTGAFLILGPNVPPYQYINNLQRVVRFNRSERISSLMEGNVKECNIEPILLDSKTNVSDFLIRQLSLSDSLILQGPPGTGKTFQIATICKALCEQGQSVLVTALTNRALMEVAGKDLLKGLLQEGKIHKTKMSVDESKEIPDLQSMKQLSALPGNVILSTFYITSGEAPLAGDNPPFDVVIMDEASQALFGMFAVVKLLGKKCIFVGDTNQLSPVIAINTDRIARRNYHPYVDGLVTMNKLGSLPSYRLTETYRLPVRAAQFTGMFYNDSLTSKSSVRTPIVYSDINEQIAMLFHPQGGPTLLKTDLPLGDKKPIAALMLTTLIVSALLSRKEKMHISVLTFYVETTKALQRMLYQTIGNHNNLLVDTVSRIQGLTTDVTIYVVPNTSYYRSLDRRLFNVATSRARRQTIIITDHEILSNLQMVDADVSKYLSCLNEHSFYIPTKPNQNNALENTSSPSSDENGFPKEISILQETNTNQSLPEPSLEDKKDKPENFIPTEVPKIEVKVVGKIDLSKFETKKSKPSIPHQANTYIIDTNVFVDCPDVISRINKESSIVLSAKVVDELDKLKIMLDAKGITAVQRALRNINKAMDERDIDFEVANTRLLPRDFDSRSPDNMILSVALKYKDENPILLTSDNGLQIKAKGVQIPVISLKEFLKGNPNRFSKP